MAARATGSSQTLSDVLDRFMQEEKVVMDSLRVRMAMLDDVEVHSVFKKLAEIRGRYIGEIESQFGEIKSRAEITKQINDMFL